MEKILILVLIFTTVGLWFGAIIDISRSRFKNVNLNTIWLLIVLFFPILGSIFYFLKRKKLITKEPRKFQPNFNKTKDF